MEKQLESPDNDFRKEEEHYNLQTVNYSSYEEFYASIDEKGSLGILALGAAGLLAWRKKRKEILQNQKADETNK